MVSVPAADDGDWHALRTHACGRLAAHRDLHRSIDGTVAWVEEGHPLAQSPTTRDPDYFDRFTHSAVWWLPARDDDSLARPTRANDTEDSQMRVCTRCGERKSIENFRYQPTRGTHHRWCRDCERAAQRQSAARRTNRATRRAGGARSTRNNGARVFGVEMELTGPDRNTIARALDAANVNYRVVGYQATNGSQWELKTDGSVGGHGLELVSPKLQGEAGFAELQRVCEALRSVNATVDRTCGVHVHVDFRNVGIEGIRNAILPLAEAQDALFEMSAPSRRRNHYVPAWSEQDLHTFRRMTNLRDLGWLPRGVVNAQSYTRHGSIEFRSHGGSTSFVRISAWVRMLIAAVEHGERTNGGSLGDGTAASLLRTIGTSQEDANVLLRFTNAAQMLEGAEYAGTDLDTLHATITALAAQVEALRQTARV